MGFVKFYLTCGLVIAIIVFRSGEYRIKLFGKPAVTRWQRFWAFVLFAVQAPVIVLLKMIRDSRNEERKNL